VLRFLITLLLLAISHSTLANNNFDADGGLIKLGIIGQDFKYIDLDQAIEFFKIGNEGAKSTFPYKANDYIEIIEGSTSPFYTSITLKVLVKPPIEDENEVIDFIKTDEGIQIWCDGVFYPKYMKVNNHQYEIFYIIKIGKKEKLILLNNEKCK